MIDNTIQFHPLAEIFPLIEGEDFNALCQDIREHGLREPIVIFDNQILDGRNRYRACETLGIEPVYKTYEGSDPVSFVVSLNLNRRHLNESQRALIAAKLANLRLGGNQHSEGLPIGRASKLLNVGERSVARARDVLDHGASDLQGAVARGAISVSAAADVATTVPIELQPELVARGEREILRRAQEIRAAQAEQRRAERDKRLVEISNGNSPLPSDRRYPVVYADAPWQYECKLPFSRETENHYPTMPIEEICALPVADLCTPDAMLFLWVPAPLLPEGLRVLEAWGFKYRTCMFWDKQKIGMGVYTRQQHEHILIGARGNSIVPEPSTRAPSVLSAPRGAHSEKPQELYENHRKDVPDAAKDRIVRSRAPAGLGCLGQPSACRMIAAVQNIQIVQNALAALTFEHFEQIERRHERAHCNGWDHARSDR